MCSWLRGHQAQRPQLILLGLAVALPDLAPLAVEDRRRHAMPALTPASERPTTTSVQQAGQVRSAQTALDRLIMRFMFARGHLKRLCRFVEPEPLAVGRPLAAPGGSADRRRAAGRS